MSEPSGRRGPSIAIVVVLALVVVIDVAAVTTALRARQDAVAAAVLEVERRVEIQARTLESALARARAEQIHHAPPEVGHEPRVGLVGARIPALRGHRPIVAEATRARSPRVTDGRRREASCRAAVRRPR